MKKYIVIALAALVAFSACTKTNPEEKKSEKISFTVANYMPQTKANVSILPETEQFMSKAYLHAAGVEGVQNYFGTDGETIKWFADDAEWRPDLNYYWPKNPDSYINFVSWFDNKASSAGNTITVTETSIVWACNDIAADQNFMFADEAWGYKNNDGALYKKDGVTEGVPTLFHHALAKLSIKAKAAVTEKNGTRWDITLEDMLVNNFVNCAKVTLTNAEPSTKPSTAAYTAVWERGNTAGFAVQTPTDPLTTSEVTLVNEKSAFPILRDIQALVFNIRIKAYQGTATDPYSEEVIPVNVLFNTLGDPAITAWEMNTKYTYTIIINPETEIIKFDPAVEEWNPEVTATYTWSAE